MTNSGDSNTAARPRCGRLPRPACPARASEYRPPRAKSPVFSALGAALLGGLLLAAPARAVEFGGDGFQGSLDTTISHGMTFRVEERDGELAADINGNDGNLNYDRGVVSNTSKFTADLDVHFGNVGLFVRTTGFIDFENRDGERARTPLSDAAKDYVGSDLELLDAYMTAGFDVGGMPLDLRIGRHVLNWGESTFIPNGINAINPFDVSKLRRPGSELREALLPVGMASVSLAPTDAVTVSGFYQFDWQQTWIDPVGSYFSTTDYAGPGARKVLIPNLRERDDDSGPLAGLAPLISMDLHGDPFRLRFDPDFASVVRGPDRTPDEQSQWGVALRYLAEDLNHTEFGFYFLNYHSRLPLIGVRTASPQALQAGVAAAGAVSHRKSNTFGAVSSTVRNAFPAGTPQDVIENEIGNQIAQIAGALAVDKYAKGGHYYIEYPEDLQLFGVSFNTVIGASGWALQGEYSLRPDAPLQRAERTVVEDGLRPMLTALHLAANDSQRLPPYLASYQPKDVQGYIERHVSQVQATATRVFGPALGADSLVFVTEAALMHVHDMPDTPLESPAGGILAAGEADADATSWGYRLAARLDYNNAVAGINLFPYVQFLHDVSGNSPTPSGPFVEGRTALTIGLRADYLSNWQADLSYTRYAGDGNELADRDFVSLSFKCSF